MSDTPRRASYGAQAHEDEVGKLPTAFPRAIGPNAMKYLQEVVDSGLTVNMIGRRRCIRGAGGFLRIWWRYPRGRSRMWNSQVRYRRAGHGRKGALLSRLLRVASADTLGCLAVVAMQHTTSGI